MDHPALSQRHVEGASLYADRYALIAAQRKVSGGRVVEIGVATGDFSEFLMATLKPILFVAIDFFNLHNERDLFGKPPSEWFGNRTHREFYERRFSDAGCRVELRQGMSYDQLEAFPDDYFDLIYVDAGHQYENVKRDLAASARKLARDGVLVCNDYTMFDHLLMAPYGVVQAVNEMVVAGGWRVSGFALERRMFCDIALVRA